MKNNKSAKNEMGPSKEEGLQMSAEFVKQVEEEFCKLLRKHYPHVCDEFLWDYINGDITFEDLEWLESLADEKSSGDDCN